MKISSCCWVLLLGNLSKDLVVHGDPVSQQDQYASNSIINTGARVRQHRSGSKLRRKEPPNRRLRRGKLFQNGDDKGRDESEWEDGKTPKANGSDGLLARHGGGAAKETLLQAETDSSGARDEQYDALSSGWTSWGVQWVGEESRDKQQYFERDEEIVEDSSNRDNEKTKKQQQAGARNGQPDEDWTAWGTEWVQDQDRAGGSSGFGSDVIMIEDRAGGDKKGGGRETKGQERGKKASGILETGKRKGLSGGGKKTKGGGNKGKRRLQDRTYLTRRTADTYNGERGNRKEGNSGNVFDNPNNEDTREETTADSRFTEVKQSAKASIDNLKDLDLFSNQDWAHTFLFDDGAEDDGENAKAAKVAKVADDITRDQTVYSEFGGEKGKQAVENKQEEKGKTVDGGDNEENKKKAKAVEDENSETEGKGKNIGEDNEVDETQVNRAKEDDAQENKENKMKGENDGEKKGVRDDATDGEDQNKEMGGQDGEEDQDNEKIAPVDKVVAESTDATGTQAQAFDQYSYLTLIKSKEAAAQESIAPVPAPEEPTPVAAATAPTPTPTPTTTATDVLDQITTTEVPGSEEPTPVDDAAQTANPEPEDEEAASENEAAAVLDAESSDTEAEENFGWEDSNQDGDWVNKPSEHLSAKILTRGAPSGTSSDAPSSVPTLFPTEDRSDCKICSHGRAPLYPDRTILHTKKTCEELAGELDFTSGGTCGDLKAEIPIDLEAYCGCEGVTPTSWCTFCPEGTTNLYATVSIPALNGMTCEDVELYTAFISDQEVCDNMEHLAGLCCGTMQGMWRSQETKVDTEENMEWGDEEDDGFGDVRESGDRFR